MSCSLQQHWNYYNYYYFSRYLILQRFFLNTYEEKSNASTTKAFYSSVFSLFVFFLIESKSDTDALPVTHSSNINKEPVYGYCLTVGSNRQCKYLTICNSKYQVKIYELSERPTVYGSSKVDRYRSCAWCFWTGAGLSQSEFKAFTL